MPYLSLFFVYLCPRVYLYLSGIKPVDELMNVHSSPNSFADLIEILPTMNNGLLPTFEFHSKVIMKDQDNRNNVTSMTFLQLLTDAAICHPYHMRKRISRTIIFQQETHISKTSISKIAMTDWFISSESFPFSENLRLEIPSYLQTNAKIH